MVIYTPRLCNDVAFLPPRNNHAHPITCQEVLRPDEVELWKARKAHEAEGSSLRNSESEATAAGGDENQHGNLLRLPVLVGGIEVGGKKHVGGDGRRIDTGGDGGSARDAGGGGSPGGSGTASGEEGQVEVVAASRGKAKGGKVVQGLSDEELRRLNLDPKTVEALKKELQDLAGDKGWKLEIVNEDGAIGRGGDRGDGREGGGEVGQDGRDGIRLIRGIIEADDDETTTTQEETPQDGNHPKRQQQQQQQPRRKGKKETNEEKQKKRKKQIQDFLNGDGAEDDDDKEVMIIVLDDEEDGQDDGKDNEGYLRGGGEDGTEEGSEEVYIHDAEQ